MPGVDGHEHLDHVILGQTVEDHRRDGEDLSTELADICVERQQPMLPVDRAQDAFSFGHLEVAQTGVGLGRLKPAAARRWR